MGNSLINLKVKTSIIMMFLPTSVYFKYNSNSFSIQKKVIYRVKMHIFQTSFEKVH